MKEVIKIETRGRRDLDDFFKLSGVLSYKKLPHTPFLAFVISPTENKIKVELAFSIEQLMDFSDEIPVMCQWRGQWSSDFFQFTVGEARYYYKMYNKLD